MVPGKPSLNPLGRPKGAAGLARYVAEQTQDGQELIDRLLQASRGEVQLTRGQEAATLALIDRVAGKPISQSLNVHQTLEPATLLPENWDALPEAEQDRWLDDLERRVLASGGKR